ncbi:C6 transcription factor [Talaromyces proteolyticus]|uniref:C6 transcription factor n=1 Tax=Talaromyces proteolyticus TaxID=1131652 RepID=A0AAD4KWV8_9EURO|nr:C6 transcription factor [Talaromyces proteolyticus]KAH8698677.1 C6 transcription factor [Talaromyces proteolyticus]
MPESSSKPSTVLRKSAFSCEACRKRKVKCNGASPTCSRCAARGDVCVYSLAPTLSYTKTLETRIAELEEKLAKTQEERASDSDKTSKPSPRGSPAEYSSSTEQTPEQDEGALALELSSEFEGLTIEQDGRVSFHGPTSLFHLLPSDTVNETASSSHLTSELEARKERLMNNAWHERAIEQLSGIPEPFQYLLDFHWCWIQPLFNFVYRPAFTRDMKASGPYYSDILLNALLSHSVRWCMRDTKVQPLLESFDGGAKFFQAAVTGTFETLRSGYPKIPTVQTLLLLSAQECGRGNRAQAWLYSGMAFRLVEDLGISIDSRKYSRSVPFTDEDIEIRNRLFWSCYFWDKLICLYFGRSPAIQNSRVSPPRVLLDDTAESEIWYPHGVTFPQGAQYPPMPAHSTSCFVKMCALSEILNQILIHIYDPLRQTTEIEVRNCIAQQERHLSQWWDELPDFLRLVANELPPYSPPSHIVTLNCLYHTVNILLHRPILCGKLATNGTRPDMNHLVQCMCSATSICALFDLYRRTFGDSHVVLSLAYSLYTAVSIFLLEIKALKYAAAGTVEKVKFCVFALERVKRANHVITTGLTLIYQELQKLQVDIPIPIPPSQNLSPSHIHSQNQSPPSQDPSSRNVSPHQQPSISTPSPIVAATMAPSTTSTTTPPLLHYQQFQHQLPIYDPGSQIAFMPDLATPRQPTGPMPPGVVLNQDGSSMRYELHSDVYDAFSYVEPMNANMAPAPYDSTTWTTGTNASVP